MLSTSPCIAAGVEVKGNGNVDTRGSLQRLDPHGKRSPEFAKIKSLAEHKECSVCHGQGANGLTIKENVESQCALCHNKQPHSGVMEHIGKKFEGKLIVCMSCHSPHRFDSKDLIKSPSYDVKIKKEVDPKFTFSTTEKSMLAHDCKECHKWKN